MNEHTQSGIYDLEQTPSGEITCRKIGTKKQRNAQFPRSCKGNFYHLSLNGKKNPYFNILTTNTSYLALIEPENSKNYVMPLYVFFIEV